MWRNGYRVDSSLAFWTFMYLVMFFIFLLSVLGASVVGVGYVIYKIVSFVFNFH